MSKPPPYIIEARGALAKLVPAFEQMATQINSLLSSDKELSDRVADLSRRLSETEQRAVTAERRAEKLADKANRLDRMDEASRKLLQAFDRLPVSMQEAILVPGAVKPSIPLYGTYEWQAVVDAKFWLKEEMKERRVIS